MNSLLKKKPLVSIIVRIKDEEKWITSCLKAIFDQDYKNFELIIVDNNSSDHSRERAKRFKVKIINIKKFKPGKAINDGIRNSSGEIIVCLSGHCVPTSKNWLSNLIKDSSNSKIAGVYGRQEPFSFSSDLDKRDLINLFGLDKKIQIKDTFFHNANSSFTRKIWKKFPFDENVSNIEDRVWAEQVISAGLQIIYEPKASVYHYHGINHDLNSDRARNIVKILESLNTTKTNQSNIKPQNLKIAAIIPIRGKSKKINGKSLLEITINSAKKYKYVNDIIVSTDEDETISLAKKLGVSSPFKRPPRLSDDYASDLEILKFSLEKIESENKNFDLIVCLKETYPFRSINLIDDMIQKLLNDGLDTIFAGKIEKRSVWKVETGATSMIMEGFMPRNLKTEKTVISLFGLCCVTYPSVIRSGDLFNGKKVGIYEIEDQISSIEVRDKTSFELTKQLLKIKNVKN